VNKVVYTTDYYTVNPSVITN